MFAEVNKLVCFFNFCGNPGRMGKEESIDVQGRLVAYGGRQPGFAFPGFGVAGENQKGL